MQKRKIRDNSQSFLLPLPQSLSRRELLKSGATASAVTLASGFSSASFSSASGSSISNNLSELYTKHDALSLAELVRKKEVTAEELLSEAVLRAELLNPKLNAIVMQHHDLARKAIEQGLPDGPFKGVPFLLKNLGSQLAGTVTTGGSRLLKNAKASKSNTMVKRQLNAGLVVFGKTNTPEFGLALTTENLFNGDCLNPWNITHSTGGSSGGSAAAVAAGILPMAHATDGGGSIRVPAAHCGLFGFKPSRGLTPGASGSGMSIGHVVSRSVRDSAAMLDATAGYEPGAPYWVKPAEGGYFSAIQSPPRPLRVAVNLQTPDVKLHPDCKQSVLDAAKLLESLGHHVELAAPKIDFEQLNHTQNILMTVGVYASLSAIETARGKPIVIPEIEPMTAMVMQAGRSFSQRDHAAALSAMHALGLTMGQFMQNYDIILQPVTATPAPKIGVINYQEGDTLEEYTTRFKQISAFTHQYNMSGQPSMSVPLAMSKEGLPIGVMFSGRVGEDALLFSLAAQLEQASPWFDRVPVI
ncbi:MAG: amidase [Pseudomonadales bacterium]